MSGQYSTLVPYYFNQQSLKLSYDWFGRCLQILMVPFEMCSAVNLSRIHSPNRSKSNRVLHKLDEFGCNASIGIRGFTM